MDPIQDALTRSDGVAARLRRLREEAGLAAKDIAEKTGFFASKVSRLENGKQTPSEDDLRKWVGACGADASVVEEILDILAAAQAERHAWKLRMRHGQEAVQAEFNKLAADATLIRHFELVAIPGLIQTPEYMRAMFTEMARQHGPLVDDVDQAITKRLERQRLLYESGRRFEFLLAESVLRWVLCPPDVLRGQLERLHAVIGMPNVRFGILPFGVRLSTIPTNSVVVYVGDDTIASVETFAGQRPYRDEGARAFNDALDRMWADAVEGEAARRRINEAIEALSG